MPKRFARKFLIALSCMAALFFLSLLVPPGGGGDYSRILFSAQGELLRVWLNKGEQYQFPKGENISEKYKAAVLHFEDKRFNWHFGIDPIAVVRAAKQNIGSQRIESGASTITMQLARLKNPSKRTFFAKLREARNAMRMELWKSKDEIFAEYASMAPMGGNIVGAETACWRFFGHGSEEITWAQAALLAVLPNRPSALNLERERGRLLERRNGLLKSLANAGYMSAEALSSSMQEPLPRVSADWRFKTPHYAEAVLSMFPGQKILHGTIDGKVQEKLERAAKDYGKRIREYSSVNISVLITDTKTGEIKGYLGSLDYYDTLSKGMIDGVRSRRSTGSILKPFLYALAIERGPYTKESLLEDVPSYYSGFSPQNADKSFSGIVPLKTALIRSLNVPAVRVLASYGVEDFLFWLKGAGLGGLFRAPEDYGLSLILGGSEASLAELLPLYSMLINDGKRIPLKWIKSDAAQDSAQGGEQLLGAIAAWSVKDILTNVKRPGFEQYHAYFNNQIPVSWKTGTSYGSRDAWAIGANEQWTIGVWVGNFEGGSVANLSGSMSAAPLLFSLFNSLSDYKKRQEIQRKDAADFKRSGIDFEPAEICALSGYKAQDFCPHKIIHFLPPNRSLNQTCRFHKKIIISKSSGYEVCSKCWDAEDTLHIVEEHYSPAVRSELRKTGREPKAETLHNPKCPAKREDIPFSIIYPESGAKIFLPSGDAVNSMGFVASAAHKHQGGELQWFLDGMFLGSTMGAHKMTVNAEAGEHRLGIQDAFGRYAEARFKVIAN